MYCKNCNNQLEDNPKVCPYCGQAQDYEPAPVATPLSEQTQTYDSSYDPALEKMKDELAGKTLKWGILSLAFAVSGCIPLLGLIFSFIAKRLAKEYVELFGELDGRAGVGRGLGIAGFIAGLVMTIFWTLYFLIFFFAFLIGIFSAF